MSFFKRMFEADEWRLCGTLETPIVKTAPITRDKDEGMLHYYLYENQHGKRKFDVADTFRGDLDMDKVEPGDIIYRTEEYMLSVKPWIGGRKITGVASYDKVGHHDLVKRLKEGD